jgi:hypothetical protein
MWQSPAILRKIELLSEKIKALKEFEQGDVIARGFSDLGFEEFLLTSDSRMISLFTGETTEITTANISFFFKIPDFPQLLNLLASFEVYVDGFNRVGVNFWEPELANEGLQMEVISADSPWSSMIELLFKVVSL